MSPTGVDLKVIGDRLAAVADYLGKLRALPAGLEDFLADDRNPAAAESLLRRSLEALFDTARHLLAKGHALGPLEYREVARLAAERGLIRDPQLAERFQEMAGFRNRMTHFYREITPLELHRVVTEHLGDVEQAAAALRLAAARLAREPG